MFLSYKEVVDKDAIIRYLTEENKQLREHIKLLEEKIARLEKNSSNSSKPPLSDIVNPQPTKLTKLSSASFQLKNYTVEV